MVNSTEMLFARMSPVVLLVFDQASAVYFCSFRIALILTSDILAGSYIDKNVLEFGQGNESWAIPGSGVDIDHYIPRRNTGIPRFFFVNANDLKGGLGMPGWRDIL